MRSSLLVSLSLFRAGPVGLDRMLGHGLELPSAFQDTHLGRIGSEAPAAAVEGARLTPVPR